MSTITETNTITAVEGDSTKVKITTITLSVNGESSNTTKEQIVDKTIYLARKYQEKLQLETSISDLSGRLTKINTDIATVNAL